MKYHVYYQNEQSGPMSASEVLSRYYAMSAAGTFSVYSEKFGKWTDIKDCLSVITAEAAAERASGDEAVHSQKSFAGTDPEKIATNKKSVGMTKKVIFSLIALPLLIVAGVVVFALLRVYHNRVNAEPRVVSGEVVIVQNNAEVRKLALVKLEIFTQKESEKWGSFSIPYVANEIDAAEKFTALLPQRIEDIRKEGEAKRAFFRVKSAALERFGRSVTRLYRIKSPKEAQLAVSSRRTFFTESLTVNYDNEQLLPFIAKEAENDLVASIVELRDYLPADIDELIAKKDYAALYNRALFECIEKLRASAVKDGDDFERKLSEFDLEISKFAYDFEFNVKTGMYSPGYAIQRHAETITDGDGRFSLKLTPGKYLAVARASRKVVGRVKEEEYLWAVHFTVEAKDPNSLLLGNHNIESNGDHPFWASSTSFRVVEQARRLDFLENQLRDHRIAFEKPQPIHLVVKAQDAINRE